MGVCNIIVANTPRVIDNIHKHQVSFQSGDCQFSRLVYGHLRNTTQWVLLIQFWLYRGRCPSVQNQSYESELSMHKLRPVTLYIQDIATLGTYLCAALTHYYNTLYLQIYLHMASVSQVTIRNTPSLLVYIKSLMESWWSHSGVSGTWWTSSNPPSWPHSGTRRQSRPDGGCIHSERHTNIDGLVSAST